MVEFALVSLIVFFLIYAIFEFGRYMFVEHTIKYAAQEGARTAMMGGSATCNATCLKNAVRAKITTAAQTAINPDDLKIYIYAVTASAVPADAYKDPADAIWKETLDPNFDLGAGGEYRKLRLQYTFHFILPLIKPLFPGGLIDIDATVLYRNEKF
jgi:Flp pilus assembly protein TadG